MSAGPRGGPWSPPSSSSAVAGSAWGPVSSSCVFSLVLRPRPGTCPFSRQRFPEQMAEVRGGRGWTQVREPPPLPGRLARAPSEGSAHTCPQQDDSLCSAGTFSACLSGACRSPDAAGGPLPPNCQSLFGKRRVEVSPARGSAYCLGAARCGLRGPCVGHIPGLGHVHVRRAEGSDEAFPSEPARGNRGTSARPRAVTVTGQRRA